jgi:hypothetical protein
MYSRHIIQNKDSYYERFTVDDYCSLGITPYEREDKFFDKYYANDFTRNFDKLYDKYLNGLVTVRHANVEDPEEYIQRQQDIIDRAVASTKTMLGRCRDGSENQQRWLDIQDYILKRQSFCIKNISVQPIQDYTAMLRAHERLIKLTKELECARNDIEAFTPYQNLTVKEFKQRVL